MDADISSLRVAMVGASALPPGVRRGFEAATRVPLLEGYGLTEATCASVRDFVRDHREGTVGQRMPYQRMKAITVLDDGTWVDLPAGEIGVLAIHGPTVFPGYVAGRVADGSCWTASASCATAGSKPATSAQWTRTVSFRSWAGPRTSSFAAATTSTRR